MDNFHRRISMATKTACSTYISNLEVTDSSSRWNKKIYKVKEEMHFTKYLGLKKFKIKPISNR
jgi:hypothetical protein